MAPVKILMALPLIGPATNHKVGEEQNRQDELFNLLPHSLKSYKRCLSCMIVSVRPFREAIPRKSAVFFLILFKKSFTRPPHSFEYYVVKISEGILTKVRKRLSQQLSTK